MADERIIRRVRSLIRLANGTNHLPEAVAARQKATDLIRQHGITREELWPQLAVPRTQPVTVYWTNTTNTANSTASVSYTVTYG